MTRTPAPALSHAEAAIVARFEGAPTPPEVVVETVARALWIAQGRHPEDWGTSELTTFRKIQDELRRLAAAGIAALPPSPAACGDLSPSINFGGDSDAERLMCELPVNHDGAHQHDNGDGLPPTRWIATGPSPAEEAVKRVEALCQFADGTGRVVFGISGGGAIWARDVRAALASPAPATQGEKPPCWCGRLGHRLGGPILHERTEECAR